MPDTGAPWNIPYVENADLVRDWPADSLLVANAVAAGLSAVGGLVEVKSVAKTDVQSASVTSGATLNVTGLTISHAMADASNKLILIAQVNGGVIYQGSGVGQTCAGYLVAGTTPLNIGNAAGSRSRISASNASSQSDFMNASISLNFVHSPGTTGSVTYGVRLLNLRSDTATVLVNRSPLDSNNVYTPRTASSLILMEVKV